MERVHRTKTWHSPWFFIKLNLTFLDSTYVDGFKQRLNDDLKQDGEDNR